MPFISSARGAYGPQGQKVIKGPLAPVWVTSGTLTGATTSPYSFQLQATDDSGDAPTYSLASGSLNPGLTLSSSGLISGTATGVTNTANFTVRATDANGRFTDSGTLTIVATLEILWTGTAPQLHYRNNTIVSGGTWVNSGTYGGTYNLGNNNVSTGSNGGYTYYNMGGNSRYFSSNVFYTVPYASNVGRTWAFVFKTRGNSNSVRWTVIGSNANPNGYGTSGALGNPNANGYNGQFVYDNDGYPWTGGSTPMSTDTWSANAYPAVTRLNGNELIHWWGSSATSGYSYYGNGGGGYSSSQLFQYVGWARGSVNDQDWDLYEYMWWETALSDTEVNNVRAYFRNKFPNVVNP